MLFQCVSCFKEDVLNHSPRMLDCGHLICLSCVTKETTNGIILCPKCLGDTLVPAKGPSTLKQGAVLKQLTDLLANAQQPCSTCNKPASFKCTRICNKILCTQCLKQSLMCKTTKCGHETSEPITMHCRVHPNFLISEYCSDCSRLLCTRCITEDKCTNHKINVNVKDTAAKKQHCKTTVPREDLLEKRDSLKQLKLQLTEIEKEVLENTQELIHMALKTEIVILQQIKQNKHAVCEQLRSTNTLLDEDFKQRTHHHPVRSNGPAITLLMEKLQLQMLEACINTPTSKITFMTGSIKPSKLMVFHDNTLYNSANFNNRNLDNIDSWELNDVYEYVTSNGSRITAPRNINGAKKLPELNWIQNDFYIKMDTSCNCGETCVFDNNLNFQDGANKPKITWVKNDNYIVGGNDNGSNTSENKRSSEKINSQIPQNGPIKVGKTGGKYDVQASLGVPGVPGKTKLVRSPCQKRKGVPAPKVPQKPKPSPRLKFENQRCANFDASFDTVDALQTPRLDQDFIEFAGNAEDYNYIEEYLPAKYKSIDWTYPPNELNNWTKDSSRILVTPDGQTILTTPNTSSTQIWTFNDSGQQKHEPKKVNYKVLDMTYSNVHKCIVLLDNKIVHYIDENDMMELFKIEIPKSVCRDYSLLSCTMLHRLCLLLLHETKGKLKLCVMEVSDTGSLVHTVCSDITSNTQHLIPHSRLEIKTDAKYNIYIINRDQKKIVIINSKCKFLPALTIPTGSVPPPTKPETGIFLTCNGKVGYVDSKSDNTFAFYWISTIKDIVHLTENTEQIICVGHSGLHIHHKERLFNPITPLPADRVSPSSNVRNGRTPVI